MTERTRSRPFVDAAGSQDAADPDADILSLDRWADMLGLGSKAVLTTTETASVLRISEKSVREGIKIGSIPSIRIGRRLLIPVPLLLSYLLKAQAPYEVAV